MEAGIFLGAVCSDTGLSDAGLTLAYVLAVGWFDKGLIGTADFTEETSGFEPVTTVLTLFFDSGTTASAVLAIFFDFDIAVWEAEAARSKTDFSACFSSRS